MKLLKSVLLAVLLTLSVGLFPTISVACEDGRTCIPFSEALGMIDEHLKEAIIAIEEDHDIKTILDHIRMAKNYSKEINENDRVDIARGRANGLLRKAKSAVKKAKMSKGVGYLKEALKKFAALKNIS